MRTRTVKDTTTESRCLTRTNWQSTSMEDESGSSAAPFPCVFALKIVSPPFCCAYSSALYSRSTTKDIGVCVCVSVAYLSGSNHMSVHRRHTHPILSQKFAYPCMMRWVRYTSASAEIAKALLREHFDFRMKNGKHRRIVNVRKFEFESESEVLMRFTVLRWMKITCSIFFAVATNRVGLWQNGVFFFLLRSIARNFHPRFTWQDSGL